MTSSFKNSKKTNFLKTIPTADIESYNDLLTARCKFNFAYMDFSQQAGQRFDDWSKDQLSKLLNKFCEYSRERLTYWQNQKIGPKKKNSVLEIYEKFPNISDFKHPVNVPHQARWARFRLENLMRLIGFVLPSDCHQKVHPKTGFCFDCNTFYVVFLLKFPKKSSCRHAK